MVVRPLQERDRDDLLRLYIQAGWTNEAEALEAGRLGKLDTSERCARWIAQEQAETVGYAELIRDEPYESRIFEIKMLVAAAHRGNGVGDRLWSSAAAEAKVRNAKEIRASVRDDDPISLNFATHRGFSIESHLFESELKISEFASPTGQPPSGVRIFSMADVPDNEENRRKLWKLNDWEIDAGKGACRPFERFEREVFQSYWYRPEGQIVAAIGDTWVGLSAVGITGEAKAYNMMTGTVPEFRNRGIATALKVATILWAKDRGARSIGTHNDSQNAPMLAINRKLGYRPLPGWYRMRTKLAAG